MNRLLYFAIAIMLFTDMAGQDKSLTLQAGPTGTVMKINDKAPSALTYSNFIYGTSLEYTESTTTWDDGLYFHFQRGILESNIDSPTEIKASQFQLEWYRLWNLNVLPNSHQKLGFQWHNDFTHTNRQYFPNNSDYYCFSSSLSPEIMLEKNLVTDNRVHLSLYAKWSVGLFAYVIRPSIASTSPISSTDHHPENIWEYTISGRFVSFLKYHHVESSYGIVLWDNKPFFATLEYRWNYFSYKIDNPYYEINHQIAILLGYKIK